MKLSYNWLKDYLEFDLTPAQVADAITSIGIEVDSVEEQEEIPGGLAGVVVAEVLECEPHPDSDHLHVTKVDAGDGNPVTVVCGAPTSLPDRRSSSRLSAPSFPVISRSRNPRSAEWSPSA